MIRFAVLTFALLLGCIPARATEVESGQLAPLGYCQLTSLSSATALSSCTNGIPQAAQVALIVAETQAVRWRDDGTAPTASVGMPITANGTLTYQGDLTKIQFIQQSASATVDIAFYTYRR